MSSQRLLSWITGGYLALFFAYLFLPLFIMVAAAFNAHSSPALSPWQGFTLRWFGELFAKDALWAALWNSLIVGFFVVLLSLTLGLAGALLLARLQKHARTLLYGVLVSPVLTPGVILGVSTLLFWREFGSQGGLVLTVLAQSTFIAAYCMLLIMARMQRFDPTLEEAALDLGASHRQVFWKITLPFLRPALLSGAVLAFLQSFENYNTTLFVIGREMTLTLFIGSAVRSGQEPTINALAVIFIALTVVLAVLYEVKRRAERARETARREAAERADTVLAAA